MTGQQRKIVAAKKRLAAYIERGGEFETDLLESDEKNSEYRRYQIYDDLWLLACSTLEPERSRRGAHT